LLDLGEKGEKVKRGKGEKNLWGAGIIGFSDILSAVKNLILLKTEIIRFAQNDK